MPTGQRGGPPPRNAPYHFPSPQQAQSRRYDPDIAGPSSQLIASHLGPPTPTSPAYYHIPILNRPPIPPFPISDRRPISAPSSSRFALPASVGNVSSDRGYSGRSGRGGYAPSPLSAGLINPYVQSQGSSRTGRERQDQVQVGNELSTSSRLDHPPPSYHTQRGNPQHSSPGHTLNRGFEMNQAVANSRPARRYTFPRHVRPEIPLPPLTSTNNLILPPLITSLPIQPKPSSTPRPHLPPIPHPSPVPRSGRPPADHSTSTIRGYQPDYIRPTATNTRRPIITVDADSYPAEDEGNIARVLPPPIEAFMILNLRREPRGGYPPIAVDEGSNWTVDLEIVQEPSIGQSLGERDEYVISSDTPILDPPLVVRVRFLAMDGTPVSDDHKMVEKRLAYMTLHLTLFSVDTGEEAIYMRYTGSNEENQSPSNQSSLTSSSGSGSIMTSSSLSGNTFQLSLVGPTFGVAKRVDIGGGGIPGWYFLFPNLRVRPEGQFKIVGKLIDVLGPGPSGTSTGITPIAASISTSSFVIFGEDDYPGSEPLTGLTSLLVGQGLISRNRGTGSVGSSSEESSD